jgi:hypothetical protein
MIFRKLLYILNGSNSYSADSCKSTGNSYIYIGILSTIIAVSSAGETTTIPTVATIVSSATINLDSVTNAKHWLRPFRATDGNVPVAVNVSTRLPERDQNFPSNATNESSTTIKLANR